MPVFRSDETEDRGVKTRVYERLYYLRNNKIAR